MTKFLSYHWLTNIHLPVHKGRCPLLHSNATFPQVRFLCLLLRSLRARRYRWRQDMIQLVNSLTTITMTKCSVVVTSREYRLSIRTTSVSSIQTEQRTRSYPSLMTLMIRITIPMGTPSPTRSTKLVVRKTGCLVTTKMVNVS